MNNTFKRPQQKSSSFAKIEEQLEEKDISTNINGCENKDFDFTKKEEKRQIRIWIEEKPIEEKPRFFMGIIVLILLLVLFSYFSINANENLGVIILFFALPVLYVFVLFGAYYTFISIILSVFQSISEWSDTK